MKGTPSPLFSSPPPPVEKEDTGGQEGAGYSLLRSCIRQGRKGLDQERRSMELSNPFSGCSHFAPYSWSLCVWGLLGSEVSCVPGFTVIAVAHWAGL